MVGLQKVQGSTTEIVLELSKNMVLLQIFAMLTPYL